MTADLPCTVRRIDGGSSWHLPRAEADGGQPGEVWCGARGRMDGLAIGTRGLRICDACVAAVRAREGGR